MIGLVLAGIPETCLRRITKTTKRLFSTTALLVIAAGSVFSVGISHAEDLPAEIRSDNLEYQRGTGQYFLKGAVRVKKGDMSLQAEEAVFDEKTSRLRLIGDIFFENTDFLISASDAELDLSDQTGTLNNSYLLFKKDNYHINARSIERVQKDRFLIRDARFTTCDAPVPAWCFTTSEADAIIGDRLKANNVVLRIKGVPVLYTPFLWAPILTDRKTGLLFPRFGYSSERGYFYRQPVFIVLADNRDTTLTLDYMSAKGFGEGLEYRYVEKADISGQWNVYHIRDRELDKDFVELNVSHSQRRREGFSHFLDLHTVNDRRFYQEYGTDVETRISRFLESTASLSYTADPVRLSLSGHYWYDLQLEDRTLTQRLPRVAVTLRPVGIRPLMISLDTEAVNFVSEESLRVQRYSAAPALYSSIGDTLRLVQTARAVQSYYEIDNTVLYPSSTERTLFEYEGGLNMSFFRKYDSVVHTLEPEAGYRYVTASDHDAPHLDALEAIEDVSDTFLSLENRFISQGGTALALRIEQAYDMRTTWHQLKPLEADLYIDTPLYAAFELGYDHYEKGIAFFNGETGVRTEGFHAGVGQRYTRREGNLFYTGRLAFDLTGKISLDNTFWYDARGEGLRDVSSSLSYRAQCWGISVTYTQKPDDEFSVLLAFELRGLGDFKVGAM